MFWKKVDLAWVAAAQAESILHNRHTSDVNAEQEHVSFDWHNGGLS